MLENYFAKPDTVDRIRECWIGRPIEQYVEWLEAHGYSERSIRARVPLLRQFGEFAAEQGARSSDELVGHVGPFIAWWLDERGAKHGTDRARQFANEVGGPVEQFLEVVLADYRGNRRFRAVPDPFATEVPQFTNYLREERGLRETSVRHYGHYLRRFEAYLTRVGANALSALSPAILSAFIIDSSRSLSKNSMTGLCSSLRVFLGYLHREEIIGRDLASSVEGPQQYRQSNVPRSISWDEVRRMLEAVDRRTQVGKRDYVILLLLVTYGLRAREVARLTLDDIDWDRERLLVPERKAGHCTAYPLSTVVGAALVDYLRNARPDTNERAIFFAIMAPWQPMTYNAVSCRVSHYLRKAGIQVRRPGSHTLRHTCVQRLIDAEFPLKTIGDYVGHRSPSSTEVYSKVAVESLRQVAIGDGEELL